MIEAYFLVVKALPEGYSYSRKIYYRFSITNVIFSLNLLQEKNTQSISDWQTWMYFSF